MDVPRSLSGKSPAAFYNTDYLQWLTTTADQLRRQALDEVDWDNLIEEIEDMGKRERRSLKSNLIVLLLHLLKWQYQPTQRTGSWAGSIVEHRRRIQDALQDSPSLTPYLAEVFAEAYRNATKQAAAETMLDIETFPPACEFAIAEVMTEDFLPQTSWIDSQDSGEVD